MTVLLNDIELVTTHIKAHNLGSCLTCCGLCIASHMLISQILLIMKLS